MDARPLNYARWRLAERIRQVDALCDEAELRGVADAPPELAYLGIGLGWMLWLLERARIAEIDDPKPDCGYWASCELIDTLPSIAGLLHVAAGLRRA